MLIEYGAETNRLSRYTTALSNPISDRWCTPLLEALNRRDESMTKALIQLGARLIPSTGIDGDRQDRGFNEVARYFEKWPEQLSAVMALAG